MFPSRYAHLEVFADWVFDNEQARSARRHRSDFSELQLIYDRMMPQMSEILDYLDSVPLDAMTPEQTNLFHLTLAFAHIVMPVEYYGQVATPGGCEPTRWVAQRPSN